MERLVGTGLVARRTRPGRRYVELRITASGVERRENVQQARHDCVAQLLEVLPPAERQSLAVVADAILRVGPRGPRAAEVTCRRCDWSVCEPDCPVEASITSVTAGPHGSAGPGAER